MNDEREAENGVPIVIDVYGVKVLLRSRPHDLEEAAPSSWTEVKDRVARHLMRIAVAPTSLIATVLESATRLVGGISRVPGVLNRAVEAAHTEADSVEQRRQDQITRLPNQLMADSVYSDGHPGEEALTRIETVLKKYRVKGLDAYLTLTPEGEIVVVVGAPPNSEAEVLTAVNQARPLSGESQE